MKKIALDGDFDFTDKQLARLNAVGQVEKLKDTPSGEEWLKEVSGYDVICTWGKFRGRQRALSYLPSFRFGQTDVVRWSLSTSGIAGITTRS